MKHISPGLDVTLESPAAHMQLHTQFVFMLHTHTFVTQFCIYVGMGDNRMQLDNYVPVDWFLYTLKAPWWIIVGLLI